MPIRRISLVVAAAAGLLAIGGCQRKDPQVIDAWVRLPAVAGQPAAAYFTILGDGREEKLARVETEMAQSAELHASMAGHGGMMTMAPLAGVAVPAADRVAFAPGGRHVMLIGLDPRVKPGTAVPLRFGFASGKTAEAEAKTVRAGEPAPY